jgi:glycosyltransferase involved in cell wall biosynthesis
MIVGHVGVSVFPPLLSRRGGAIQRRILELARAQRAAGHQVIAVSVGATTRSVDHQGVQVELLRCWSGLPLRHVEFQARAVELLLDHGVDLIHFHSQPEGALVVRGRAPSVLSYDAYLFRGAAGRLFHGFYRDVLARFDALLPCSEHCRDTSSEYWGLPEERTHVLHNGVDLAQFAPDPEARGRMRARLGLDGPTLLYVGRVCEQKGSDLLLEAFTALHARRPEVRLVVAGPVGQFDQRGDPEGWRRRLARAGAHYLGPVDEEELASVYNAADVFVMPTRRWEMFGMAAVEAQACGVPVVASDCGGLRETVPGGCGLRFQPGSAAALAESIEALLQDAELRKHLGEEARRRAARFGWAEIARRADAVYGSIAAVGQVAAQGV